MTNLINQQFKPSRDLKQDALAALKTQANSGASTLIFEGSSNFLLGHTVEPITGIQVDTNISGVLTEDGETTVTIDKFLTATLPAGTVIEFDRGRSPLTFESSQTQGGFVDQIVIQDGGSNFDAGPFFNVPLTGGNGTGLRSSISLQLVVLSLTLLLSMVVRIMVRTLIYRTLTLSSPPLQVKLDLDLV